MTVETARAAVLRAAEQLRVAHGSALGALEAELRRVDAEGATTRSSVESSAKRDQLIAQTLASNAVIAAHSTVRDNVLDLTAGAGPASLRVASIVEVGDLLVNAKRAGIHSSLDTPLLVPLLGRGSLTVIGGGERADDLVRSIQLQALQGTAPGQLALAAYDPRLGNPLAPFARLNEAEPGLVRTVQSAQGLNQFLDDLTTSIARVGTLLQGSRDGLVEHRESAGKQIELFQLVSLHNYPEAVTEQQHARLLTLARAAPRHGISFIIQIDDAKALPAWCDLGDLKSLGDSFEVTASRTLWSRKPELNAVPSAVQPAEAATAVARIVDAAERSTEVHLRTFLPEKQWTESSAAGLTVTLAQGPSGPIDVTFGDDMPHGLITGSSGSGKSNLIKLLIYGLSARYSPDELEFTLLDMKEGVTLAPLAPSRESSVSLPHARVIGLQADQEFGLSVLQEVERVYKRRMNQMSPFDNIKEYREAHPDVRLPRIMLIVDEFQLLLAEDANRVGKDAAARLLSLVKLVRAAGIHLVLATQEISSLSALAGTRDGLMAQIKLRVALKNTSRGSEDTLETGNTAAADLRVRGAVVVNDELGAKSENRIGRTPYADEKALTSLRTEWYERRPADLPHPTVFNGRPPADLLLDLPEFERIRHAARDGSVAPRVVLGRAVSVNQSPLAFVLEPGPGRNLAIVGNASSGGDDPEDDGPDAPGHLALGIIAAAGLSLAAQHDPGSVDFVVLDLLGERDRAAGMVPEWLDSLRRLGHEPVVIAHRDVKAWFLETAGALGDRTPDSRPAYIFGLGFDRVGAISEREGSGLSATTPARDLQKIFDQGPATRLHSFFWWANGPTYAAHIERRFDLFSATFVLFGAEEVAQRVGDLLTKWEGRENRAFYRDTSGAQGKRTVIPYRPLSADEFDRFVTVVQQ